MTEMEGDELRASYRVRVKERVTFGEARAIQIIAECAHERPANFPCVATKAGQAAATGPLFGPQSTLRRHSWLVREALAFMTKTKNEPVSAFGTEVRLIRALGSIDDINAFSHLVTGSIHGSPLLPSDEQVTRNDLSGWLLIGHRIARSLGCIEFVTSTLVKAKIASISPLPPVRPGYQYGAENNDHHHKQGQAKTCTRRGHGMRITFVLTASSVRPGERHRRTILATSARPELSSFSRIMRLNSPPTSLELMIDCAGDDVRIGARGPRGENVPPRSLGIKRDALDQFKARVERAAAHGQALPAAVVAEAQIIQKAVLADEIGKVFVALSREAVPNPIFVRFMVQRDLQDVPWEALCNAGEALGFWGSSSDVLPIRGVATTEPWMPSEVRGAVKVLAIAPTGRTGLDNLKQALDDRIATGEIEWLDPIEGAAAGKRMLFEQLQRRPSPHVIHFLGHGGIDKGLPILRLADDDDEENWLPVELLAQQLKASFSGMLRLIVLEACEGAKPSAFASAAEILAQKTGADAVVAHLWPVRADVARTCSTQFYRSLTRAGDVTAAVNQARREMLVAHDSSAQALSPVLYLRGPEGRIFDFEQRKIDAHHAHVGVRDESSAISAALTRIVGAQFSLVLGDRWSANHEGLDTFFRRKLQNGLLADGHDVASGISISALAQKFFSQFGDERLIAEFRRSFPITMEPPAILSHVARRLCPGVHTSLLRHPWLEACVAKEQPNRTIVVIQYDDRRVLVVTRDRGRRDDWKLLDIPPSHIDTTTDIVILRPYGGYTPSMPFTRPLLTEDDYQRRLPELWSPSIMPVDLGYSLQRALKQPPAWLLGLSMLTTHHRTLLQNLFQQGLPRNSVAMVEKSVHERALWKQVGGKRAMQTDEDVVETTTEALHDALAALPPGREG